MHINNSVFRRIILGSLGIVGIIASFMIGGMIRNATTSKPIIELPQNIEASHETLEVYYLKDGKIVRTDSENSDDKVLTVSRIFGEKENPYQSPFVIGGKGKNILVYLVSKNISPTKQYENYVKSELHVLNMDTNEDKVLEKVDGKSITLRGLAVSPDGTKIAYARSRGAESSNILESDDHLIVYGLEDGSMRTFSRPKTTSWLIPQVRAGGGGSFLSVENWLSDTEVIISYAYEGATYCAIDITKDTQLSTQCSDLGSKYFTTNLAYLQEGEQLYGFSRIFSVEAAGTGDQQGIFKKSRTGKDRIFITNDVVSDMVLAHSTFYYLATKTQQSQNANTETDLYSTDIEGKQVTRLTENGNSVNSKQHLTVSNDGRYLAYDLYLTSNIDVAQGVTSPEIYSIWMYDTKLSKGYKVADHAVFPFVVVR